MFGIYYRTMIEKVFLPLTYHSFGHESSPHGHVCHAVDERRLDPCGMHLVLLCSTKVVHAMRVQISPLIKRKARECFFYNSLDHYNRCNIHVAKKYFLRTFYVTVVFFFHPQGFVFACDWKPNVDEDRGARHPGKMSLLMISRLRLDFGCDHEYHHLTTPWSKRSSITILSKFCITPSWSENFSSWRKWSHRSWEVPACLTNNASLGIPQTPATPLRVSREHSAAGIILVWL